MKALNRINLTEIFELDDEYVVVHTTGGRKGMAAAYADLNGNMTILIEGHKYDNDVVVVELYVQLHFPDYFGVEFEELV